jgi:hypothetical protein
MELPVRMAGTGHGGGLILDTGSLAIGVKMTGNDPDYLTGTLERIRADAVAVPHDHEDVHAILRAIVDHSERREREAQAEIEQGGTVLLEARDLQADVRLFKNNRLVRFKPVIAERTAIPVGYQFDGMSKEGPLPKLKQRLYRAPPVPKGACDPDAEKLNKLVKLAGLTARDQDIVMHMRNPRHTDTEFAKLIGISQSYLSRRQSKIIQKMRDAGKKLRDPQDGPKDWSWIDPTKFFGEDNDD